MRALGSMRCIFTLRCMYAVFCRWLETVRELLKSSANIETTDNDGMTPLLMACADGSVDIARLLLDSGANIHAASKFDGQRALQYAAFEGHLAIVQELIGRGHDVDAANQDGRTSLAFAAYKGRMPLTAMCRALRHTRSGHHAICRELLAHGANVNLENLNGQSALGWAAEQGHVEVMRLPHCRF